MTNIDDVSVHDRDRTHAVLLRHMVSQSGGHIAPSLGRECRGDGSVPGDTCQFRMS